MRIDLSCDEERNFVGFKRSRFVYTEKRGSDRVVTCRERSRGRAKAIGEGNNHGKVSYGCRSEKVFLHAVLGGQHHSSRAVVFTFRGKVCRRA